MTDQQNGSSHPPPTTEEPAPPLVTLPPLSEEIQRLMQEIDGAKTFYDILGCSSKDEEEDVIKANYRSRSLKLHPDRTGDTRTEPYFQKLAMAYEWVGPDASKVSDVVIPAEESAQNGPQASPTPNSAHPLSKRAQYDLLLKDLESQAHNQEEKRKAAIQALMKTFVGGGVGGDTNGGPRKCRSVGCFIELTSLEISKVAAIGGGPVGDQVYCSHCHRKQLERKCIGQGCSTIVTAPEMQCSACQSTPMGKKGRCSNFGCLNQLTVSDIEASLLRGQGGAPGGGGVSIEKDSVICSQCRNKPKKCKQLGCFTMCKGGGVDGSGFCEKHVATQGKVASPFTTKKTSVFDR